MSFVLEGADPVALRELADRLLGWARGLVRDVEASIGLMDNIRWVGRVAYVFEADWAVIQMPAVRSAMTAIEGFAERLIAQADDQIQSSAADLKGVSGDRRGGESGALAGSAVVLVNAGNRISAASYLRSLDGSRDLSVEERGRQQVLHRILGSDRGDRGSGSAFLMQFDPTGDGRIALSLGDPTISRNVALLVPGVGSQMGNFDDLLDQAAAVRLDDPDTAVIAWLGYDAPGGLQDVSRLGEVLAGAGEGRAVVGARQLQEFLSDLGLAPQQRVTVVGHSYGSVVAMRAAADGGLPVVDNVVALGSPGMTSVNSVSELRLPPNQNFYSLAADRDLVAGAFGDLVPGHARGLDTWGPLISPVGLLAGSMGTVRMPSDAGFGGTRLETDAWGSAADDSVGHSQYLRPGTGSLENVRGVVTGGQTQERSLQLDDWAGLRRGIRGEIAELVRRNLWLPRGGN